MQSSTFVRAVEIIIQVRFEARSLWSCDHLASPEQLTCTYVSDCSYLCQYSSTNSILVLERKSVEIFKVCQLTTTLHWTRQVNGTPICYWCLRIPNFSPFALQPTLFELQAPLRPMHPNGPRMTLNTTRYPICRCYWYCPKCQTISPQRPAVSELQAICETSASSNSQVILNTTKWKVPSI